MIPVLLLFLFPGPAPSAAQSATKTHPVQSRRSLSGRELHSLARRIAVQILITDEKGELNPAGTGFWIGHDLVATCLHVVKDSVGPLAVKVAHDGRISLQEHVAKEGTWSSFPASVAASDPEFDIALLRVVPSPFMQNEPGKANKPSAEPVVANLADQLPDAGSGALLAGFSLGGPVLLGRQSEVSGIEILPESSSAASKLNQVRILISANSILGDSGGPVLDNYGRVIGLVQGNIPAPFMDESQRPVVYIRPARDNSGSLVQESNGNQKLEATDLFGRSGIAAVIPSYFIHDLRSRLDKHADKVPRRR
jgi:S1-C subfamily serine protease